MHLRLRPGRGYERSDVCFHKSVHLSTDMPEGCFRCSCVQNGHVWQYISDSDTLWQMRKIPVPAGHDPAGTEYHPLHRLRHDPHPFPDMVRLDAKEDIHIQNRWWYGFCCCKTRNCKDPVLCIWEKQGSLRGHHQGICNRGKERLLSPEVRCFCQVWEGLGRFWFRGTTKITCSYTNSKDEKKSVVYTVKVVADDDWFHRSTMNPCLY